MRVVQWGCWVLVVGCGAAGGRGSKDTGGADGGFVPGGDTIGIPIDTAGADGSDGAADGSDGVDGGADNADGSDGDDGTDGNDAASETCPPTEVRCKDDTTAEVCPVKGDGWKLSPCPSGERCFDGYCAPTTCSPGTVLGQCTGPASLLVCNDLGTGPVSKNCGPAETCQEGNCGSFVCPPGERICKGFGAVQECKSDGSGFVEVELCEKGGSCVAGECISACDVDIKANTYRGCEYFAVDLDNIEGGQYEPVAIVVSVPENVDDATVTIRDVANQFNLGPSQLGVSDMVVKSGQLEVFKLPLGYDLDGTSLSSRSFHVLTSAPSTVHQFNPLNGEDVYTNDAALLLPSASGGLEYYAMSWSLRKDGEQTLRGFVTIIATQPGTSVVTVRPTAPVLASEDGVVGAIQPGQSASFFMEQGQVLNLEADGEQGADLTGTHITSDRQISVFGGHECANVPLGITACDHLGQQLLPVAAWGKVAVVDTFKLRSPSQFDVVRIMAGAADVTVETRPPQGDYGKVLLQQGQYITLHTSKSFEVVADGPVLVGHYLIGSSYPGHAETCGKSGIGDPGFTLVVPTQQYLDEYTVLTPPGYVENYVNIVAPAFANVTVDGVSVENQFAAIEGTSWFEARVAVTEGVHTIVSTGPQKKKLGLTAYGYDCDVSYTYPGGLRLQLLKDDE